MAKSLELWFKLAGKNITLIERDLSTDKEKTEELDCVGFGKTDCIFVAEVSIQTDLIMICPTNIHTIDELRKRLKVK